jgi:hypothetical protein
MRGRGGEAPCNREGRQEKGEREPKGREDPRTGGHQGNTVPSMYDMITKREEWPGVSTPRDPEQLCS